MDALGHRRFAVVRRPTPACRSATPWPPITRTGSTGWPSPRPPSRGCLPSPPLFLPPRTLNDAAVAPRLQPARRDERTARRRAGRDLLRRGVRRLGRHKQAARLTPSGTTSTPSPPTPTCLRGSFAIYRALDATIAQNQQRKTRRLTDARAGASAEQHSLREQVADTMKLAADDVQTLVIPGCGHWLAEQAPDEAAGRADRVPGPVPQTADGTQARTLTRCRDRAREPRMIHAGTVDDRQASDRPTIRPFHVDVPDEDASRPSPAHRGDALARQGTRRRSIAGRAAGDAPGARALLGDRATTGARARRKLNALPQFVTEIDGLDIHFIHVRSRHEDALPLIVTHGWPGLRARAARQSSAR